MEALAEPVEAWQSLPRRIYLDTCTLQTIHNFDGTIFEGEPYAPSPRALRVEGLEAEVVALANILMINERAEFEFVVTETGLREVVARGRPRYTQWVNDVRDAWLVQSAGCEVPPWGMTFYQPRFTNRISRKDRILLQDALDLACDAFMTVDGPLLRGNAEFVERQTGLRMMRPTTYWVLLKRWAKLHY